MVFRGHSAVEQPVVVSGNSDSDHMMGMKMFFHTGYEKNIVIYGWDADTAGKMIGTVIAVFVLALLYEGIKFYRIKYSQLSAVTRSGLRSAPGRSDSDSETTSRRIPVSHLIESLMYAVQVALSFTLMLFVMTFNVWIILSAVFGMMIGYALFASSARLIPGAGDDCCT